MKNLAYIIGLCGALTVSPSLAQDLQERADMKKYQEQVRSNVEGVFRHSKLELLSDRGKNHRSLHIGVPLFHGPGVPSASRGTLYLGINASRWGQNPGIEKLVGNMQTQVNFGILYNKKANIL